MLLGKKKKELSQTIAEHVLDSIDHDVVVVRSNGCKMLYMNEAARERVPEQVLEDPSCRSGYSALFPDLCDHCQKRGNDVSFPHKFDTRDGQKRIHEITCNTLEWIDGKPATVFFVRDVDEQRGASSKLYSLAYLDPLTGVPNRRKFREDFEAIEQDIADGKLTGIMAIFDLDNFKAINDTYGHSTGDLMLKRLTQHFQGDAAFQGHLYRLGGDEFILVFAEKPGTHENPQEYFSELLQTAMQSYSMPNIDLACTISMGVSFFPHHGTGTSELMRKADIALYQAKNAGRNRFVFFEDRYDLAKKFKDVYINIQPVLNERGRTFGHELIDGGTADEPSDDINLSEFNRAIDALGLEDITNDEHYFITYTNQMLSPPPALHLRKKFIIQLPVKGTLEEKDLKNYKKLHALGFKIAVSGLNSQNISQELLSIADYVKFEPNAFDEATQRNLIKSAKDKVFIATNIDTQELFYKARDMGYTLFQGYYFNDSRPTTTKTKDIEPLKVNYFQLLKLTATDDYVDFNEISNVISSDLALSYQLLKLLNSAALALPNRISSISMAVAYLGEEHLKKWISLLGMRGVAPNKPLELVRMSLVRAHFGELLAPHFRIQRNAKHVFLVGLLSLLHVALDRPKEELLAEMPLADDIRQSLLTQGGPYSDLLAFYKAYEYANWEEVGRFASENGLTSQLINDCYLEAVKWCNDLIDA